MVLLTNRYFARYSSVVISIFRTHTPGTFLFFWLIWDTPNHPPHHETLLLNSYERPHLIINLSYQSSLVPCPSLPFLAFRRISISWGPQVRSLLPLFLPSFALFLVSSSPLVVAQNICLLPALHSVVLPLPLRYRLFVTVIQTATYLVSPCSFWLPKYYPTPPFTFQAVMLWENSFLAQRPSIYLDLQYTFRSLVGVRSISV